MIKTFSKRLLSFSLVMAGAMMAFSQTTGKFIDRVHIGIWGGGHFNSTNYSNLDGELFPDKGKLGSGLFGISAEFELGEARRFSIRPELMFLSRGSRLSDIFQASSSGAGILEYKLKAKYTDIRVPVIYNFTQVSKVIPYIYVAPVFGLVHGGDISAWDEYDDYTIDVSKANMASTYFAGMLGAGVKVPFKLGGAPLHFAVEASYEYGFTDTYGGKEKDGKAEANLFFPVYDIEGTRKFSGFELKASLSVPLSIFKKSDRPKQRIVKAVEEKPVRPVEEEKPCYTLDEIMDLIAKGQPVKGKTVCAIDDMINFDFGKSSLDAPSQRYLNRIVLMMQRTGVSVEVKGHTDNKGTEEFNLNLSRKRAKAVYDYLLSKGVPAAKVSYSYYGMSKPIADNGTEDGRRKNRRVEFEIK